MPLHRRSASADERREIREHLSELRYRLLVCIFGILAGAVAGFVVYEPILEFLLDPYCGLEAADRCRLLITDPLQGFATRLRVSLYAGLFLSSPVMVWNLWRFVTPGLKAGEKRYAVPFLLSSLLLGLAGAAMGYLVLPRALAFLQDVGGESLIEFYSPGPYLRLVLFTALAFAVAFEFPVVLVFLQLAGVLSSKLLRRWRRTAVVTIFAAAAVLTPSQDPYSLFVMAVPLLVFYEGAIIIGRLLKK